jgi:hypothetical protein
VLFDGESRGSCCKSWTPQRARKGRYWLSGPFAFLQEEHTHFALLLWFVWPTSSNRHTKRKQFCTLPNSLVWDLLFDLVSGFLFYIFKWPTSFIRETDNKLTPKHQGRRIWFRFLVYIWLSFWRLRVNSDASYLFTLTGRFRSSLACLSIFKYTNWWQCACRQ